MGEIHVESVLDSQRNWIDACYARDQEFTVSKAFLTRPDFIEGIRAQVIDKDRNPNWNPATITEVTPTDVAAFFDGPE